MSDGSREITVGGAAVSVDPITDLVDRTIDDVAVERDEDGDWRSAFGREVGTRVGGEIGAVAGRGVGRIVASNVRERGSIEDVRTDVRTFLAELSAALLADRPIEETMTAVRASVSSVTPEDLVDRVDGDAIAPVEFQDLHEDALRELLEVMDYRDLQSVAKELDVKANLDRETMADEIVEAVAGDGDEPGDEGHAGDEPTSDDEADEEGDATGGEGAEA